MCERERFSTQGPSPRVYYVPLSLLEMEAPSRSCLPLWGHLASAPLAGLPQRHSVIIHSACQASSQLGSCSFSVWKGWASSLIPELSRSSAVWLEDKPENYGRAKETAGSLNHSGECGTRKAKQIKALCLSRKGSEFWREMGEQALLSHGQLPPPKQVRDGLCPSKELDSGSWLSARAERKTAGIQKKKKMQLPTRHSLYFSSFIGKMQGWDEIMKLLALTCY